jgi:hypothetical protein
MAIFTFAGYPYSLKLLWSPIVDAFFSERIGRRKSWILPIQLVTGLLFYALSRDIDNLMTSVRSVIVSVFCCLGRHGFHVGVLTLPKINATSGFNYLAFKNHSYHI